MKRVIITIEKLKELCLKCADKALAKGIKVKKVSIRKSDYKWLILDKNDRPPKDWWDACVAKAETFADDPASFCGGLWYYPERYKGGEKMRESFGAEEAIKVMTTEQSEAISKLKKDIETVMSWRKIGKSLTKEEQQFAERVVDGMIGMRVSKQTGVQLVSKSRINFIKQQQPIGSDAVGGITQDAFASGQKKSGKYPRKTEEGDKDVNKIVKPVGEKPEELSISGAETGTPPKKTPDIQNIRIKEPDNQAEGEISSVADSKEKVTPKDEMGQPTEDVTSEMIGHNPNVPMPLKQAEDLVQNAKWGVEIGAYVSVREGIERQLGRKAYAEFVDTPEKLKEVITYLASLVEEIEPVPVA